MLNSFFSRNTLSLEVLARTIAVQMFTEEIKSAVEKLSSGGVVGIPTDTLYGLAANLFDETALDRIYQIKGRPQKLALPVLISTIDQLQMVSDEVSKTSLKLAHQFWPGPLTLVLQKTKDVADVVSGGRPTVAVRVPDHPVPRVLSEWLGRPIVGTSANITGSPSAESGAQAASQIGELVDLVIEGSSFGRLESTIVDFTDKYPKILRQGAVPAEELQLFCPLLSC